MYEPSLRMPLIVRWPGVAKDGRREEALVQNLDLAPTLLEAAGVPIPADVQGESLVPLYDLQRDPDELENLYGRPEVAELTRHLTGELARLEELYAVPPDEAEGS